MGSWGAGKGSRLKSKATGADGTHPRVHVVPLIAVKCEQPLFRPSISLSSAISAMVQWAKADEFCL